MLFPLLCCCMTEEAFSFKKRWAYHSYGCPWGCEPSFQGYHAPNTSTIFNLAWGRPKIVLNCIKYQTYDSHIYHAICQCIFICFFINCYICSGKLRFKIIAWYCSTYHQILQGTSLESRGRWDLAEYQRRYNNYYDVDPFIFIVFYSHILSRV